jgi:Kef-type K+ transport system membrane component KefB
MHGEVSLIRDGAILFGFGLAFVLIFRRLGLGATLGYLVAGAVVGPHVLGWSATPSRSWALPRSVSRFSCSSSGWSSIPPGCGG